MTARQAVHAAAWVLGGDPVQTEPAVDELLAALSDECAEEAAERMFPRPASVDGEASVKALVAHCMAGLGLMGAFHPDTPFKGYVDGEDGRPLFDDPPPRSGPACFEPIGSKKDAAYLDALMAQAFDASGEDVYRLTIELYEELMLPQ